MPKVKWISLKGNEKIMDLSKAQLVFAKTGTHPFWPGKILTVNQDKYQVFYYGLHQTAEVRSHNVVAITHE